MTERKTSEDICGRFDFARPFRTLGFEDRCRDEVKQHFDFLLLLFVGDREGCFVSI